MLAFSLLLRQVIPSLCRRNQSGTWSFSEGNSPLQICYSRDNYPGRSATERTLCRLLFWAVCQRGGAWRSPDERHKMLTCSGGAGYFEPQKRKWKRPWVRFPLEKRPVRTVFQLKSWSACSKDDAFSKLYKILSVLARGWGTIRHESGKHRDWRDCFNYQGITLLTIAEKLLVQVVLKRLQALAEGVYPESHLWFPGQTLNYWFDILHQTITWKMWETETPTVHLINWPH